MILSVWVLYIGVILQHAAFWSRAQVAVHRKHVAKALWDHYLTVCGVLIEQITKQTLDLLSLVGTLNNSETILNEDTFLLRPSLNFLLITITSHFVKCLTDIVLEMINLRGSHALQPWISIQTDIRDLYIHCLKK